jgi:hypothetical protein
MRSQLGLVGIAHPTIAGIAAITGCFSCEQTGHFLPFAAYFSLLQAPCSSHCMLLDFEVQRCTRCCAATERALNPGDECYSVLQVEGANVVRKDYCPDAWNGAPETAFGWWKSRVPEPTAKKIKLAPNEVLLELFDQLAEQSEQQDLRYVLALLLVRRRVLRIDVAHDQPQDTQHDGETMTLYCPKRDTTCEVAVAMPSGERIDEIQQQLSELLVAGAE